MFISILFWSSALLTILSCILMSVTKNIIHSCVFLLGTLLGVAGLYLTLGADYVAVTQVMVYVGGVVILTLFAIMLTGGRDFMEIKKILLNKAPYMGSAKTFFWGSLSALVFFLSTYRIVKVLVIGQRGPDDWNFTSTVEEIGMSLLTDHVLAFEISSVLLLGALVGAAIIARSRKS